MSVIRTDSYTATAVFGFQFPGRGYGGTPEDSLAQRVAVARLEQKNK